MKPIAADTLSGRPRTASAAIPPEIAIGTFTKISSAGRMRPNVITRSTRMSKSAIGMTMASCFAADRRRSYSPAHSV